MELYNLRQDIGEETNIAADSPKVLARIEKHLETARVEPRPQKEPATGDYHLGGSAVG